MRMVRLALWLAVAVALVGLGSIILAMNKGGLRGPGATGTVQAGAPLGGAFSLVDHTGAPVTQAVFREKPSAVFFGFTHCPDVCPTTLMEAAGWMGELGADADKMRFVFVTVDPARDTPDVLREYISAFSDKIVGITGEPEKVEAMARDYKVYFNKTPLEGGDYSMDHTASVLLLDAEGSLVGTIAQGEPRDAALGKLKRLVAG
jgi:protein SCO1/2